MWPEINKFLLLGFKLGFLNLVSYKNKCNVIGMSSSDKTIEIMINIYLFKVSCLLELT